MALVVLTFATLVGRLGQVQLVGHADFAAEAAALDTRTIVVPALRGRILDREGRPLADNRVSTVVTLERRVIAGRPDRGRALVRKVAGVLGLPPDDPSRAPGCAVRTARRPRPRAGPGRPRCRCRSQRTSTRRGPSPSSSSPTASGVAVESRPIRFYPRPLGTSAAQTIGYLGQVEAADMTPNSGLVADDLVGRAGLEQQYDAVLRGTPGRTVVSVDPRGLVTGVVSHTDPVPGRDLVTSLDAAVQAAAEKALATEMAKARKRGWPATPALSSCSTLAAARSQRWRAPRHTTPTSGRGASRRPTTRR